MFMKASRACAAAVGVSILALRVRAQSPFEWGFTNSVSDSLAACQSMALTVFARTTGDTNLGVPPYYMMSFAVGGTPVTELIGTNATDLHWTPKHPAGSQLILGVVDSKGMSGGIDEPVYSVVAGTSTSCLPPQPSSIFTVTSNITSGSTISTCTPWGIRIQGGKPPYSVTIAATNAPDTTNVTLGPVDTVFTYINRADPSQQKQMTAAVCDSTGIWATGTPFVLTTGSTDVTCPGLESTSGTNSSLTSGTTFTLSGSSNPSSTASSTSQTSPSSSSPIPASSARRVDWRMVAEITGGALGFVLLCGAGMGLCFWRRRQTKRAAQAEAEATAVSPFNVPAIHTDMLASPYVSMSMAQSSPVAMTSGASSRGSSKHPSPLVIGTRELPPPYAHPWPYGQREE